MVKFDGPYSHEGKTLWFAKSVIAWDKDDRVIAGDVHIGSPGYSVAGLSGTGVTPEDAYRDLEKKLAELKSHEF